MARRLDPCPVGHNLNDTRPFARSDQRRPAARPAVRNPPSGCAACGCSIRNMRFPCLVLMLMTLGSCTRASRDRARVPPDSSIAAAIARDRPASLVVPLSGEGTLTLARVAIDRASLARDTGPPVEVTPPAGAPELAPPSVEPSEPPAPAANEPASRAALELKPPIPRGAPALVSGGRGGRVTLDVRVDEQGDVSDALLVESDADSLTVEAATAAALAMRYHAALLGGKPVAVWTRQV